MSEAPSNRDGNTVLPEISGYRLLRVIGNGGMSTVYLGEQISLGRQVAMKVMLPEALADEVSRRRFENEARTIARLEHPHVVGIHEVGRTRDGLPYYAMPYLPRGHLGQRINTAVNGMDADRVREILQPLLSALGYAHARGTIHRDVKAENVLFDEAERPLLADFGIALRRGFGTRVTTAGLAVGSTAYMAPEQARGEEVDHRADLYAVGVLAWEMLTGKLPYNANDALAMAVMHVKDPIPRLPPRLRHWQRFFDRALAKGPLKRYRDAAHMQEMLDRVPRRHDTREFAAISALRRGAGLLRSMPLTGWIGVLLVVAASLGMLLRGQAPTEDAFYRVEPTPATAPVAPASTANASTAPALPAPTVVDGKAVAIDPATAMLRAAPGSEAERWIATADRQIRADRLSTPKNGNAFDSLMTAHAQDPTYLGLAPAVGRLIDALGRDALDAIGKHDHGAAREHAARAVQLAKGTQLATHPALARLRNNMLQAFDARIDAAANDFDRQTAQQVVEDARASGMNDAAIRQLTAHAARIPASGEQLDHAGDMVLVRHGNGAFAATRKPVTRDEYAAFANATGREGALCRERASLLRVLAPRDWKSPGFAQVGSQPVVCVSWADAQAYAQWRSQRDGHRYRLPSAVEAKAMPAARDLVRSVAEWSNDCSGNCETRLSSGSSWRGASGARPLESDRGYDDVGIRLVSDLRDIVAKR